MKLSLYRFFKYDQGEFLKILKMYLLFLSNLKFSLVTGGDTPEKSTRALVPYYHD